jgi:hypothetical protein
MGGDCWAGDDPEVRKMKAGTSSIFVGANLIEILLKAFASDFGQFSYVGLKRRPPRKAAATKTRTGAE